MEKYEMFQLVEKDGHKGIYIGELDNKPVVVSLKQPKEEMNWHDAMEYAKNIGERLPTQRECMLAFIHKDKLNEALKANGGDVWDNKWYWSSSEYGSDDAWTVYSNYGNMYGDYKDYSNSVSCLLAF